MKRAPTEADALELGLEEVKSLIAGVRRIASLCGRKKRPVRITLNRPLYHRAPEPTPVMVRPLKVSDLLVARLEKLCDK